MATCSNCGGEVELSEALAAEMVKINPQGNAVVQHDVCPGQDGGRRKFEILIEVRRTPGSDGEETTKLASFGAEHESETFATALPALAKKLEPFWAQLQKHAAIVDADLDV